MARLARLGNYELIEKVGTGAMGEVYRARQVSMDRMVALKVLSTRLSDDESFVRRFEREARSAGACNHPNLIQVYDVGEADGYRFYSMEFIEGPTLRQILNQKGPLDEKTAARHMAKVAAALREAHRRGIVHRDVKPENIIINELDEPKLADLGLAKPMEGGADLTLGEMTIGTPHYMAPEQARGEPVDGRTDLYALGATFYHLLTGSTMFAGATSTVVLVKHTSEEPPTLRSVRPDASEEMETLLGKLLQKAPDDRYQSADELIEDLEAFAKGKPLVHARPPARKRPHPTGPKRIGTTKAGTRVAARRTQSAGLLLAVGGIGVALLIVAGIVLTSSPDNGAGRSGLPAPAGPAPSVPAPVNAARRPGTAEPSERERKARLALELARQYYDENPTAFARSREHFEKARDLGHGTPVADDATRHIEALEEKRASHAESAFGAIDERARVLTQSGDFDGALAAYRSLPDPLRELVSTRWVRAIDDVRRSGRRMLEEVIAGAERSVKASDVDAARAQLARLDAIRFAEGMSAIDTRVKWVRMMLARAAESVADHTAEAAGADPARLRSFVGACVKLFEKRAYREAHAAMERAAADPANGADARLICDLRDVAGEFVRMLDVAERALAARTGKKVNLETNAGRVRGELTAFEDGYLTVVTRSYIGGRLIGESKREIQLAELSQKQLLELARRPGGAVQAWRPSGTAGHVASAFIELGEKDYGSAETSIALAPKHPLAAVVRERIDVVRRGEAEVAAEKAWKKSIEPWLGKATLRPAEGERAAAAVVAYRAAHGETEFARAHEAIDELENRARRAKIVQFIANGGFEDGLTGWEITRGKEGKEVDLAAEDAAEGEKCLALMGKGRVRQGLDLDVGGGYRVAFNYRFTELVEDDYVLVHFDDRTDMRWVRDGHDREWHRVEFVFKAEKQDHTISIYGRTEHPAHFDAFTVVREPAGIPQDSKEHQGHWYHAYDEAVSWRLAKSWCEALGGHLVTITSVNENILVDRLTDRYSWIGLSDAKEEGTWVWMTGEPFAYANWEEDEPDNGQEDKDEHHVRILSGGTWDDCRATSQAAVICEWEPAIRPRR